MQKPKLVDLHNKFALKFNALKETTKDHIGLQVMICDEIL